MISAYRNRIVAKSGIGETVILYPARHMIVYRGSVAYNRMPFYNNNNHKRKG